MDTLLASLVIEIALAAYAVPFLAKLGICRFERWSPGMKPKILLCGYNGTRNTGADARVASMVAQIEQLLGPEQVEITIPVMSLTAFEGYVDRRTRVELLPSSFLGFFSRIFHLCNTHHMVILSEGSTLKSKFANGLTLIYAMVAGIMRSQRKPCLAYGSEAGKMDFIVRLVVKLLCSKTFFVARTSESMKVIEDLSLQAKLGTDTAWTFPPGSAQETVRLLRESGWDGESPVVGVAVINPFWWPVRPRPLRWLISAFTGNRDLQYNKIMYFSDSRSRREQMEVYLSGIGAAVTEFMKTHRVFPVLIGMEALDRRACERLQKYLPGNPPLFCSTDHDAFTMTSLLQHLSLLVTSRYHARVLSLVAGTPAISVSMDERLQNLHTELESDKFHSLGYLRVDDVNLASALAEAMNEYWADREILREKLKAKHKDYLIAMGEMGCFLREFIQQQFPDAPMAPPPDTPLDALGQVNPRA